MTTSVESAWPAHPDYRIELIPCRLTGQVWDGDVLLAESNECLIVTETDHVDRLYFPEQSYELAAALPGENRVHLISAPIGHDGFLTDVLQLRDVLRKDFFG